MVIAIHYTIMAVPANNSYPSGGTWFDTIPKSFVDVPVDVNSDNAIPTSSFLEAAESLTTLFGSFLTSTGALSIWRISRLIAG